MISPWSPAESSPSPEFFADDSAPAWRRYGVAVVSVILAWTDPQLAKFVWLLFLVVSPVAERVSRRLEHARSIPSLNAEVPSNAGKD